MNSVSRNPKKSFSKKGIVLAALIALGGCCSEESVVVQQKAQPQTAPKVTAKPLAVAVNKESSGPMGLRITAIPGMRLEATTVEVACENGAGTRAGVKLEWDASDLGLERIRAVVINGGESKTWVESGAAWSETTGPWVENGMEIQIQALPDERVLGQVHASAGTCGSTQ